MTDIVELLQHILKGSRMTNEDMVFAISLLLAIEVFRLLKWVYFQFNKSESEVDELKERIRSIENRFMYPHSSENTQFGLWIKQVFDISIFESSLGKQMADFDKAIYELADIFGYEWNTTKESGWVKKSKSKKKK